MVEKDDWEEYELIIELIVTQGLIRRGTAYRAPTTWRTDYITSLDIWGFQLILRKEC